MSADDTVKLVLCWHMHQPDYRDHIRDEFQQPWVYLHGIKDYVEMAAHLETVPGARAVVNFSPVLLEQLNVYERQISGFLHNSEAIRDPVLAALGTSVFPSDVNGRITLVKACLRANRKRQIERYREYHRLVRTAELLVEDPAAITYLSDRYLADLVTWYHLAWLGETILRTHSEVKQLIRQGSGFTLHQRRSLLQIVGDCITSIRARYARLADEGRVELSTSPYAHPMLPLLLDFRAAREAQPDVTLPMLLSYPGGEERVRWHLQQGLSVFENYFGTRPEGCWPSEGGVSDASLQLIAAAGFKWVATGENVIRNTLERLSKDGEGPQHIHTPFSHTRSGLHLFARDDTLSDLIGFTYADWHADDAVGDLIHRIETIAGHHKDRNELVISIIMDGENAWEYYPENGYYFLSGLYNRLADHPYIRLSTYRDIMTGCRTRELKKITAGSWVYGNFSTWIGDKDKNRAWDILGEVKRFYDEATREEISPDRRDRVNRQLAACEGSDWFWWFGDYNPAQTVSDFERLYRTHLANLYQMLSSEPPEYLAHIIAHGSGTPVMGGVIRPGAPGKSS